MPLEPSTSAESYKEATSPDFQGSVNPPELNLQLKPKRRAIKDAFQAKNIINTMTAAYRMRNIHAARIMAKYNAEKPYRVEALEAEGLSWKSNFSTKPLQMLVDKVAPRFVQALDAVKYLTNASLPDDVEGASVKTEAFRREITTLCRNRPGWRDLMSDVSMENALFGFAAVAWLDEFTWFPKFFRQDMFYVPTGTKQHSRQAQLVAFKENFLIHELVQLIEDKESATIRGWDIEKTVEAINAAMPENRRAQYMPWWRMWEDMIRENSLGLNYETGARVIAVWHLLATEADGQVSHYIFTDNTFSPLFTSEDQFKNMPEACSFFTFEQGNGTVHGSKGIGRQIYAMAGMLDRSRNEVVDRLNMSGKVIIQGDEKQLQKFRMSVVGNAILIGQNFNISERKLDASVEPFLQLDDFLTGLLDQMAGATSPRAFGNRDRVTGKEVDVVTAREEESKDNIITRFLTQFGTMMTTLQRRACDPDVADEDAKEMQKRLLKIMSREELKQLADSPVAETVKDFTELKRQAVVLIASEARGNPLYNQKELERRKLIAQIDEEFADAVLLPDEDPTETAEQTRLQMLELLIIAGHGSTVPVSPRDNHLVHLGVLIPAMEQAAQAAVQKPEEVATLEAMLVHGEQHAQVAGQTGVDPKQLEQATQILKQVRAALPKLQEMAQQHQQIQDQAAQLVTGAQPGAEAPPGAAPGSAPPGPMA